MEKICENLRLGLSARSVTKVLERYNESERAQVSVRNRLSSRKTVSFSLAEPYDFIPSLLGNLRVALSHNPSLASDQNWWSTVWCSLVSHLRTFFQGHAADRPAAGNGR